MDASEYAPRRAAPELGADLTALRALANTAARTAIDRHVRKNTGRQATGKFVGACITTGISLVLAYWAWRTQSMEAAAGAAIGGGLGAFWLLAAVRRLFQLMRLNNADERAASRQATVEAPAPSAAGAATTGGPRGTH